MPLTRRTVMLAVVALLAVAGCAEGAVAIHDHMVEERLLRADPDEIPVQDTLMAFAVAHGEAAFHGHCVTCHGVGGQGNPVLGAPNLTDRDWLYGIGRVSEIQQTVNYGIRSGDARGRDLADMPAFAQAVPYSREKLNPLSPGEIRDVTEFLFKAEGRTADAAAAARGGKIFKGRGGCWDCHGDDGAGDSEVGSPNLTDNIWLYGHGSRDEIFDAIAQGHSGICPGWSGKLSAAQILEISLYVYALSHGGKGIS